MDDQHLKDFENQLDKFNNPKNIDDFFKNKLNKREFSLDDKHLSNLEQQLDQLKDLNRNIGTVQQLLCCY